MDRIRAINEWMKKYAAAEGHVYLDYVSAMSDQSGLLKTELSADDLHPNAQGYAIMAPLADAAIKTGSQVASERMSNPKSQAPNPKELPTHKSQALFADVDVDQFGVGCWDCLGIWSLEFGI